MRCWWDARRNWYIKLCLEPTLFHFYASLTPCHDIWGARERERAPVPLCCVKRKFLIQGSFGEFVNLIRTFLKYPTAWNQSDILIRTIYNASWSKTLYLLINCNNTILHLWSDVYILLAHATLIAWPKLADYRPLTIPSYYQLPTSSDNLHKNKDSKHACFLEAWILCNKKL